MYSQALVHVRLVYIDHMEENDLDTGKATIFMILVLHFFSDGVIVVDRSWVHSDFTDRNLIIKDINYNVSALLYNCQEKNE